MKTIKILSIVIFSSLLFLTSAKAQDKADYFLGKWDLLATGTPGGDSKMLVSLERVDGKLKGGMFDPATGKPTLTFSKVEETEKTVTVYFEAGGYNVYIYLEKKDEDHVTGSMMDMFDVTGKRAVETPAPAKPQ
jgi:hypothetical protein